MPQAQTSPKGIGDIEKMGEYLEHRKLGEVKIGTCYNLYYTTRNQLIQEMDYFKNQNMARMYLKADGFLFRFPFPDEKGIKFGMYENHGRSVLIAVPKDLGVRIGHKNLMVRITPNALYSDRPEHSGFDLGVDLPCPFEEGNQGKYYDWNKNLEKTLLDITQQKLVRGENGGLQLQVVARCPYCGTACRLDETEMRAIHEYANNHPGQYNELELGIIEEALKGYTQEIANEFTQVK